jgi:16S rRNA C1402 N4-methylase RsmH
MSDKAERKLIMRFGDQVVDLGLSVEQAEQLDEGAFTYWPDRPLDMVVESEGDLSLLIETHDASVQPPPEDANRSDKL